MCHEGMKPAQLLSSLLAQLSGAKRRRRGGYAGDGCDNANDLLHKLPGAS
jgi:hypothetical protein